MNKYLTIFKFSQFIAICLSVYHFCLKNWLYKIYVIYNNYQEFKNRKKYPAFHCSN